MASGIEVESGGSQEQGQQKQGQQTAPSRNKLVNRLLGSGTTCHSSSPT